MGGWGFVCWGGWDIKGDTNGVRRWANAGSGSYRDLPVSESTITDIRPLPAGGVAVGSADPAITLLDVHGNIAQQLLPAITDFRSSLQGFLISDDGLQVKFAEYGEKSAAIFDIKQRQITVSPASSTGMRSPDSGSLNIRDWENTSHPTLNKQALKLDPYEISTSLAIAPDQGSFLLGTAWSLRRFDRNGRELWQQSVSATAWGVNISGNGKLAVAAFGDGTIRWYRYSDGQLLLSFFPHKDKKRWILWTPSGYYDASVAAEGLIGWHVNRGNDAAAAFYPASKFRRQFYRSDITARILTAGSEAAAIKLADAKRGRKTHQVTIASILPPSLTLLSPDAGSGFKESAVTLRLRVDSPDDAPLTRVRVRINGKIERNVQLLPAKNSAIRELVVTLPKEDAQIMVFGINRHGISEAASTRLIWMGKRKKAIDPFKPKLYVLAVGISKYRIKGHDLGLAAKDATDFSAVFASQKGKLYGNVQLKLLTDAEATKDNLLGGCPRIETVARNSHFEA